MTSTPSTELDRRLREALRPVGGQPDVDPSFVDHVVARATLSRRRRRVAYGVAAPLAAAAMVVAIVVVAVRQGDTVDTPIDKPGDSRISLSRWLENRTLDLSTADPAKPAAAGTAMYRSCDDGDCTVTLVSPSGREIDLADVAPSVAEQLAEDGLADVSLSPTGHWLGVPSGGAYWIHHLESPGLSVKLPASSDGDRWQMLGWSANMWGPMLALYDGDRVVRFARGTLLRLRPPTYLDVPDGVVTTPPVGSDIWQSPVNAPAEPVDGLMPRVATTVPPTDRWFAVRPDDPDHPPGEVFDGSDHWMADVLGQSFEGCVGPDETLAGPDGRIHQWSTRSLNIVLSDVAVKATALFSRDTARSEPVAVVLRDCEPQTLPGAGPIWQRLPEGGRVELPTTTAEETWEFLGMLPDGQVAMLRTTDDQKTYVRITEDGELDPMYDLPADAEVVVPGGVLGW
jgi:hypothetical protein